MTSWRYLVQRATTGQWLHTELPLDVQTLAWELSGPGALKGTLAPAIGSQLADDGRPLLEEWGTLIYAEADGVIRWGGIVISSSFSGSSWELEAAGFTTYPHGIPYGDTYTKAGIDPADVVAHLWDHVQEHPDAKLGVQVTGDKTTVKLGGGDTSELYELLWWETPDVGSEIDSLASVTPFDYVEEHTWDGDEIKHEVRIGYPRLGRKRTDLSFTYGENVIEIGDPQRDGDDFANEVIGIGAGEGTGSVRSTTAKRDGKLRRPYVYTAKDVGSRDRLTGLIRTELTRRQQLLTIPSITVRDHSHAPLASWSLGDDILVRATLPWLGDIEVWHRVVGWELESQHMATLDLVRSDAFTYGG